MSTEAEEDVIRLEHQLRGMDACIDAAESCVAGISLAFARPSQLQEKAR
jgi:hypothetical protein